MRSTLSFNPPLMERSVPHEGAAAPSALASSARRDLLSILVQERNFLQSLSSQSAALQERIESVLPSECSAVAGGPASEEGRGATSSTVGEVRAWDLSVLLSVRQHFLRKLRAFAVEDRPLRPEDVPHIELLKVDVQRLNVELNRRQVELGAATATATSTPSARRRAPTPESSTPSSRHVRFEQGPALSSSARGGGGGAYAGGGEPRVVWGEEEGEGSMRHRIVHTPADTSTSSDGTDGSAISSEPDLSRYAAAPASSTGFEHLVAAYKTASADFDKRVTTVAAVMGVPTSHGTHSSRNGRRSSSRDAAARSSSAHVFTSPRTAAAGTAASCRLDFDGMAAASRTTGGWNGLDPLLRKVNAGRSLSVSAAAASPPVGPAPAVAGVEAGPVIVDSNARSHLTSEGGGSSSVASRVRSLLASVGCDDALDLSLGMVDPEAMLAEARNKRSAEGQSGDGAGEGVTLTARQDTAARAHAGAAHNFDLGDDDDGREEGGEREVDVSAQRSAGQHSSAHVGYISMQESEASFRTTRRSPASTTSSPRGNDCGLIEVSGTMHAEEEEEGGGVAGAETSHVTPDLSAVHRAAERDTEAGTAGSPDSTLTWDLSDDTEVPDDDDGDHVCDGQPPSCRADSAAPLTGTTRAAEEPVASASHPDAASSVLCDFMQGAAACGAEEEGGPASPSRGQHPTSPRARTDLAGVPATTPHSAGRLSSSLLEAMSPVQPAAGLGTVHTGRVLEDGDADGITFLDEGDAAGAEVPLAQSYIGVGGADPAALPALVSTTPALGSTDEGCLAVRTADPSDGRRPLRHTTLGAPVGLGSASTPQAPFTSQGDGEWHVSPDSTGRGGEDPASSAHTTSGRAVVAALLQSPAHDDGTGGVLGKPGSVEDDLGVGGLGASGDQTASSTSSSVSSGAAAFGAGVPRNSAAQVVRQRQPKQRVARRLFEDAPGEESSPPVKAPTPQSPSHRFSPHAAAASVAVPPVQHALPPVRPPSPVLARANLARSASPVRFAFQAGEGWEAATGERRERDAALFSIRPVLSPSLRRAGVDDPPRGLESQFELAGTSTFELIPYRGLDTSTAQAVRTTTPVTDEASGEVRITSLPSLPGALAASPLAAALTDASRLLPSLIPLPHLSSGGSPRKQTRSLLPVLQGKTTTGGGPVRAMPLPGLPSSSLLVSPLPGPLHAGTPGSDPRDPSQEVHHSPSDGQARRGRLAQGHWSPSMQAVTSRVGGRRTGESGEEAAGEAHAAGSPRHSSPKPPRPVLSPERCTMHAAVARDVEIVTRKVEARATRQRKRTGAAAGRGTPPDLASPAAAGEDPLPVRGQGGGGSEQGATLDTTVPIHRAGKRAPDAGYSPELYTSPIAGSALSPNGGPSSLAPRVLAFAF